MPTARVMSWNVESFGATKAIAGANAAGQGEIVNFIANAIVGAGASIVGIMEVKSGYGATLAGWLTGALNNLQPPPGQWRAALSLRQDGGPYEEYLLLWRDQPGVLTLNAAAWPAPTYLVGVFDPNVLANLPAPAVDQAALVTALNTGGYIVHGQFARGRRTKTWRVNPAAWPALGAAPPLNLGALALTPAQDAWVKQALLGFDVFRFTTYGDRSPFVGQFLLGAAAAPLTVVLFHAPGPQDTSVGSAINLIAQTQAVAGAGARIVMGDFNVTSTRNILARNYNRFGEVVPRTYQNVFAPFGVPSLLGVARTTLTNAFRLDQSGVPPVALLPLAVRRNDYDKFFFFPSAAIAANGFAQPVDVVADTSGNLAGFSVALGTSSLRLFRALRGVPFINKRVAELNKAAVKAAAEAAGELQRRDAAQNAVTSSALPVPKAKLDRLAAAQQALNDAVAWQAEIAESLAALAALTGLVTGAQLYPPGVGSAAAAYRHAVSDHLPIAMRVQFA